MILRWLGIGFLVLCACAATQACTCSDEPPGKCPGLQTGDVVFLGTVTSIEEISNGAPRASDATGASVDVVASRLTRYHFKIDERFAGPAGTEQGAEIDIFSGGDDGDCAYRFKQGQQYVVFTEQGTEGRLFATICNGTRPANEARALLPQLRAMRNGQRVASVFGILRRADPPFLAPPDDPEEPLGNISLKLRSMDDRFETSTNAAGIYSFYDVHAGEYRFTANLPVRMELTQKSLVGGLPPFKIPNEACYEYDVDALPTGHIRGSVVDAAGKPLALASVELYRAGSYEDSRPGLWGFQGAKGTFDFDHVGPGEYVVVFNRSNRLDPNSPFHRTFYPGVSEAADAEPVKLKDGQQLLKVNIRVKDGYPTRQLHVKLQWPGARPAGNVTVMAKADQGENPAARKLPDGTYQFTVLESGNYTVSAWEDLTPQRSGTRSDADCAVPDRIEAAPSIVSGADADAKEITLAFAGPACSKPAQ